jgi:PHP family Zn ribbon phosphoesterase
VKQTPGETSNLGTLCPVCGKKMTIGVMHRMEQLAGRSQKDLALFEKDVPQTLVKGTYSKLFSNRPGFIKMVPLQEILAESLHARVATQKVQDEYNKLTDTFKNEFTLLLKTKSSDIVKYTSAKVVEGIEKVRKGDIVIDPGYDGVFGTVKIWQENSKTTEAVKSKDQMSLF